jgi:hypothetical protein
MKFVVLRRWLFPIAAAMSLVLCLAFAALGARSLGHFERVDWRYNRWRGNDLQTYFACLSWYSNTLRVEFIRVPIGQASLDYHAYYPLGSRWSFVGDETTAEMNGYPAGFYARHDSYAVGHAYVLAVRPWLPTLLAAILPAIWLIQYRRRHGTLWRFGLRELLASITVIALLLTCGLWLAR